LAAPGCARPLRWSQDAQHGCHGADKLSGLQDRALGFAGAFRRSELVALDVADIEETATDLLVTIRHSKTDQDGHGDVIAIARGDIACPVLRIHLDPRSI
jgi:hypothetical protein